MIDYIPCIRLDFPLSKKETSEMTNNPRTPNRDKQKNEAMDEVLYWRVLSCVRKAENKGQNSDRRAMVGGKAGGELRGQK